MTASANAGNVKVNQLFDDFASLGMVGSEAKARVLKEDEEDEEGAEGSKTKLGAGAAAPPSPAEKPNEMPGGTLKSAEDAASPKGTPNVKPPSPEADRPKETPPPPSEGAPKVTPPLSPEGTPKENPESEEPKVTPESEEPKVTPAVVHHTRRNNTNLKNLWEHPGLGSHMPCTARPIWG